MSPIDDTRARQARRGLGPGLRLRSRLRQRRRGLRGVALTVAAVVLGTGIAGLAGEAAASAASPTCQVGWKTSSWPGGFTADVSVTSSTAVHGWTLAWTWPAGQHATQSWSATVTESGSSATATNAAWNADIPSGGSVGFGFQGTWSGSNPVPAAFTLNGVACAGGTGTATGTPSQSPPPTQAPTQTPTPTPTQTPTQTPTPPPPAGCGSAVFCDGLESQTSTTPSGSWTVVTPDCSGSGRASVDATVAHSGSRSLRVDGVAGYCNHVFVQAAAPVSSVAPVYVRFWVRHTNAQPTSHTTFLAMNDSADGDRDLRMGGQNGALQWNRESDDATLPAQSPVGVGQSTPLPTGSWHCVEAEVDGSAGALTTWLDGSVVPGLVADRTPTADVDSQWDNRTWSPRLTDLRLGWESYGEGADTLWFDDVAVSAQRIGC